MTDHRPTWGSAAFDCPNCEAYANQTWYNVGGFTSNINVVPTEFSLSRCAHCNEVALWRNEAVIYPTAPRMGAQPSDAMPAPVRSLYDEARAVGILSRRSAAALLRLALQVLVNDLVPGKGDINSKIGALVSQGLDARTQRAMDALRVIGNNAVHPGEIRVDDEPGVVESLFDLLNLVVEEMIDRPARIDALYASLPEGARAAIERRDKPKDA